MVAPSEHLDLVSVRRDAERYPRLCVYPPQEAISRLSEVVVRAHFYKGIEVSISNVEFIASSLYTELLQNQGLGLKYITIEEIDYAIRKEILEQEVFGISVSTLYRAIAKYALGEGNQIAKKK